MFKLGRIHRLGVALAAVSTVAVVAALSASGSSTASGRQTAGAGRVTAATLDGTWRRLPASPIVPDFDSATSVWSGSQMLVYGRDTLTALDKRGNPYAVKTVNVAAAYTPATGAWRRLAPPTAADAVGGGTAVWTGKEMLVVGAFSTLVFDPQTNHWQRLSRGHGGLVVWAGREMIAWGGGCCGDAASDGVAYNPATDKWRKLPRSPLAGSQHPVGAWTGRELVILVGNLDPDGKPWPARLARAAAYNPATNTWRRIVPLPVPVDGASAAWDGRDVLVVGAGAQAQSALAYKPTTNSWRRLAPMTSGRSGALALWSGRQLLVFGGLTGHPGRPPRNGLAYEPESNRWTALSQAPLPRTLEPAAVWTGSSMMVWGGVPTATWGKFRAAGAAFTPTQ